MTGQQDCLALTLFVMNLVILLFFAAPVCTFGWDVHFHLGLITVDMQPVLETESSISGLVEHVDREFPQLWISLTGRADDDDFFRILVGASTIFVSCVFLAFYGVCLCVWTPYRRRTPSAADLCKAILQSGWDPVPEDLRELESLTPCQLGVLDTVRRRCKELHLRALPALRSTTARLGFSSVDLEELLTWMRERAPIVVHVNLARDGLALASDTHYRNQFETFTSGGTLDSRKRSAWEDDLFDMGYAGAEPFDRCKYGALNVTNDPQGVRACKPYGCSYLLLRGVRLRATLCSTDSAGMMLEDLATLDYCAHILARFSDEELKKVIKVATGRIPGADSVALSTYREVQIHGEVRLADHVEMVMVCPCQPMPRALGRKCNTHCVWIEGGRSANCWAQADTGF